MVDASNAYLHELYVQQRNSSAIATSLRSLQAFLVNTQELGHG